MKKLLITLVTLMMVTFSSIAQTPAIFDERVVQNGNMFVRIINSAEYTVGCSLEDEHSFHTFYIHSGNASMWYRVYGKFDWYCE